MLKTKEDILKNVQSTVLTSTVGKNNTMEVTVWLPTFFKIYKHRFGTTENDRLLIFD